MEPIEEVSIMKRFVIVFVLMIVIMALIVGCSKEEKSLKVNQDLAARIGKTKITMEEVDKRFDQLGPQQRDEFEGRGGKAQFVDKMIEEQLIYNAALDEKLDRDEEVRDMLAQARRSILANAYIRGEIFDKIEISDEETEEYYRNNEEEFTTRALIRASHIFSKDSLKAVAWKKRIDAGEKFDKLAKEESEDKQTAPVTGDLGYFNPGGYIKFIGYSQKFSDEVVKLEVGEISGVIAHERGYSVVKVRENHEAKVQALTEVRKQIMDKLRSEKAKAEYEARLLALKKKHKPENFVREMLAKETRTPEELWEIAQMEDDPYGRIHYYRKLAEQYPDNEYASQALFMIGFVYAEELMDYVQARRTFQELIKEYPDGEVIESAKWMINNMAEPHPKLESLENIQERMQQDQKTEDN